MVDTPSRTGSRSWVDALAPIALLIATASVCQFLTDELRAGLHSDSALKSVLAAVALHEGRLVPHSWTFANGDILTATPYVVLVPLQGWFGMSFGTNAAAVIICLLAMLGALYGLARSISSGPRSQALVTCALAASAMSSANLEFLTAQGAYSLYAALAFLLFSLLLRPASGLAGWMPAVLSFLLAASNPMRAWVAVLLPAILAHMAVVLIPVRGQGQTERAGLAALIPLPLLALLTGSAAGHLAYALAVMPEVQNFDAAARISPASVEHMRQVASRLPSDWFGYFQVAGAWSSLSIPMRLLQLGVWVIACAIPVAPAVAILSKRTSPSLKHAAWLTYAMLASGLLPLVVLEGLYQGTMEVRYATLGILMGVAVLPALAYQLQQTPRRGLYRWTAGFLLIVATATSFAWQDSATPGTADVRGVSLRQRMALVDMLREQRVGTAVATYWNSHVLSVLSSGTVMVNPVGYGERLAPFAHHVPNEPLHGSAGPLEAVILSDTELAADGGDAVIDQLGEPKSKLKSGSFNIWLYPGGTAAKIFAVGHRFDAAVAADMVAIQSSPALPSCGADDCSVRLRVWNRGRLPLATAGKVPMRVGLRGLGKDGQVLVDLGRVDFQVPLQPGQSDDLVARIGRIPSEVVSIQACLLQEQVQWLCDRTGPADDPSVVPLDQPVDPASVGVVLTGPGPSACKASPGVRCRTLITIRNTGRFALNGPGSRPLVVGFRAQKPGNAGGGLTEGRVVLPQPLGANAEATAPITLEAGDAGLDYQVCMLQEHVAWLCERTTYGDVSPAALDQPVDPALVGVVLTGPGFSACASSKRASCRSTLTIRNVGKLPINGHGSRPLVIGYRRASVGPGDRASEGRITLPHPLGAGAEVTVPVILEADQAGQTFQVCLLQEHVAWLCDRTLQRAPGSPLAP